MAIAAKRLGLARRPGEDDLTFKRRVSQSKAWLRGEPYYADRNGKGITVHPTGLGLQLLEAVQERTGRDFDDIVEHLLRRCAPKLTFDEVQSTGGAH